MVFYQGIAVIQIRAISLSWSFKAIDALIKVISEPKPVFILLFPLNKVTDFNEFNATLLMLEF